MRYRKLENESNGKENFCCAIVNGKMRTTGLPRK